MTTSSMVEEIRTASRTMVREWGFMQSTLGGTEYSASAVHTLVEIEAHGSLSAAQLVLELQLDKSTISRMISKLVAAGELTETAGDGDGRIKRLVLTDKGKKTVAQVHSFANAQVNEAVEHLSPADQEEAARGLTAYADALKRRRLNDGVAAKPKPAIQISTGYRPGVIGRVSEMHATYYSKLGGFGMVLEGWVARGISEFVERLDQPCNQIWVATLNGRIVGSLAIDGQDLGNNVAHLRWFILDDGCRGSGIGRQLIASAVKFCDEQGFAATKLWTFKGLDVARKLYESYGYELAQEQEGDQWGPTVMEQMFIRKGKVSEKEKEKGKENEKESEKEKEKESEKENESDKEKNE